MGCRENATGRSVGRLVGLVGWGGGMGRKRRKGPLCPGGFSVGFEYVVMDRHDRICHHYFSKGGLCFFYGILYIIFLMLSPASTRKRSVYPHAWGVCLLAAAYVLRCSENSMRAVKWIRKVYILRVCTCWCASLYTGYICVRDITQAYMFPT